MRAFRFGLEHLWLNPYFLIWRAHLRWIFPVSLFLAASVAAILYLSPPRYVSKIEILPPDLGRLRELLVNPGQTVDLERFYAYLTSEYFQIKLIDSLNLIHVYRIRSDNMKDSYRIVLEKIIENNLKVRVSKNASIMVSYRDTSPELCYDIMQFIVEDVRRFMIKLSGAEAAYREYQRQLAKLSDSLNYFKAKLSALREKYKIVGLPDLSSGNSQIAYQNMLKNPESFKYFDDMIIYERNVKNYNDKVEEIKRNLINIEGFLRVHSEYAWLIVPPIKPIIPTLTNTEKFIWTAATFLISLLSLSLLVIYAYRLGFLHIDIDSEYSEILEKSSTR